jgi:hypothetical protein
MSFFTEIEKSILNSCGSTKDTKWSNLEHKEKWWWYHNTGLGSIVAKTTWYWNKNRHVHQWNRREDQKISSHSYTHLISNKGAKTYIGQKTASSTNGVGKTRYLH